MRAREQKPARVRPEPKSKEEARTEVVNLKAIKRQRGNGTLGPWIDKRIADLEAQWGLK
jgi:hypothetical protein